jgi:protein-S-isoprenylcysteine O-methyltransferase Ste14
MEKREGKVKDLAEKLKGGKITPEEAFKRLKERKLLEEHAIPAIWAILPWPIYFILWLPLNIIFLDRQPVLHVPSIVIYLASIFLVIGIFFVIWAGFYRRKRGGLNKNDTIILCRDGPYGLIRHPEGFGMLSWFISLPIIFSAYISFTLLSVAAILLMVIYVYWEACVEEERLDIPKWGDEYRQYMKEVPRYNFIKGLWNLRKRGE